MKNYLDQLKEAKNYLEQKLSSDFPKLAVVLGSGLSDLAEALEVTAVIPYAEIPHFPKSTVEGHKGNLVVGTYQNQPLALFQGRVHFYEGYTPKQVVFPVRLFKMLGGETLVLTNAAGSLNPDWAPGEVMMIQDHINFTGYNPLVGPNLEDFGPRFNDMSEVYKKEINAKLKKSCLEVGLKVHEGTYIGVTGPSYETPAEIKAFRTLGASAVGMSTVPEAIAASHAGLKVAGFSLLTNFASGISDEPLSHQEVQEASLAAKEKLIAAMKSFLERAC